MQSSKSETGLSDTAASTSGDAFEVISEADIKEAQSEEMLHSPQGKNDILLPGQLSVFAFKRLILYLSL